jgi:hypothetical protein
LPLLRIPYRKFKFIEPIGYISREVYESLKYEIATNSYDGKMELAPFAIVFKPEIRLVTAFIAGEVAMIAFEDRISTISGPVSTIFYILIRIFLLGSVIFFVSLLTGIFSYFRYVQDSKKYYTEMKQAIMESNGYSSFVLNFYVKNNRSFE